VREGEREMMMKKRRKKKKEERETGKEGTSPLAKGKEGGRRKHLSLWEGSGNPSEVHPAKVQ